MTNAFDSHGLSAMYKLPTIRRERSFYFTVIAILVIVLVLVFLWFNFDEIRADVDPGYRTYLTLKNNYDLECVCEQGKLFLYSEDNKNATPLCKTDVNVFVPRCVFEGEIESGS